MGNATAHASRTIQSGNFHNLPPVGTVMPREKFVSADVAAAQASILQFRYGKLKSPAKQQSRDTGQSERACRNQQNGLCCMSLTEFFNACQTIPELRQWGALMLGLKMTNDPSFEPALKDGVREIKLSFDFNGTSLVPRAQEVDPIPPPVRERWNWIDRVQQNQSDIERGKSGDAPEDFLERRRG